MNYKNAMPFVFPPKMAWPGKSVTFQCQIIMDAGSNPAGRFVMFKSSSKLIFSLLYDRWSLQNLMVSNRHHSDIHS
jgi:hypothetical protein